MLRYIQGISVICILAIMLSPSGAWTDSATDLSGWKHYENEDNGFSFGYPPDWEVIDEGFYKTHYGVTLHKIGQGDDSDNWIRINSPQFQAAEGCCVRVQGQQICTYSQDAVILGILQKIAAGFVVRGM